MARLTTIRLYGALGARFGRVHKLAVQTSAEAVKALCINLDGLESYLMSAKKIGMTFAVFRGKRNSGVQDFQELAGDSDIRIAPIMEGAKKSRVISDHTRGRSGGGRGNRAYGWAGMGWGNVGILCFAGRHWLDGRRYLPDAITPTKRTSGAR